MNAAFGNIYQGKTVLVTGHTGFKGSWLCIWLRELGANVVGYSLDPPTRPSNFDASHLSHRMTDIRGDVRDLDDLTATVTDHQPEIIFHLAAQAIVLDSYRDPYTAFGTNAMGTVGVLEAVRQASGTVVKAVVAITTDKVYENQEWIWGYRENDRLAGHDPYSASKAMAELAIKCYSEAIFRGGPAVASARAGNVIGGGDWAPHRLVPDCMRSLMGGEPLVLRNPGYVRPWQHLLEPLSGYLWLGARLLAENGARYTGAWNFGPLEYEGVTAEELVKLAIGLWGSGAYEAGHVQEAAETRVLRLNWDKAANLLHWRPIYSTEEALVATVDWFRDYQRQLIGADTVDMYGFCLEQIEVYSARAEALGLEWGCQ